MLKMNDKCCDSNSLSFISFFILFFYYLYILFILNTVIIIY